jgi:hypothetical protein
MLKAAMAGWISRHVLHQAAQKQYTLRGTSLLRIYSDARLKRVDPA